MWPFVRRQKLAMLHIMIERDEEGARMIMVRSNSRRIYTIKAKITSVPPMPLSRRAALHAMASLRGKKTIFPS